MQLRYTFTDDDVIGVFRHMSKSGQAMRQVQARSTRQNLIGLAMSVLAVATFIGFTSKSVLGFALGMATATTAMLALWAVLHYGPRLLAGGAVTQNGVLEKGLRKLIATGAMRPFRGEVVATITPDAVEFECEEGLTRINTAFIERVDCAEGHLFLWRRAEIAGAIPLRAFASNEDLALAVDLLSPAAAQTGLPSTSAAQ